MDSRLLPFIAGGMVLVALIVIVIRFQRQKREALREALRSLGFIPFAAEPDLAARLTRLYTDPPTERKDPAKQGYKVENVFGKPFGDGKVYLFDLIDRSSNDNARTEEQAVAIVSGRLELPSFIMTPRTGAEGALANLADRAIAWTAQRMGEPVAFADHPEFERRYFVHSPEPEAVRRFMDGARLGRLAETRHLAIHAGDDVFTLSPLDRERGQSTTERLRERVDRAMSVYSTFTS